MKQQSDHAGWRHSRGLKRCQPGISVPFGEPSAFFVMNQWKVPPPWRGRTPEGGSKSLLSGGAGEQIVAANDIGHPLGQIIHDHRKLIARASVPGPEDEIAALSCRIEMVDAFEFIPDGLFPVGHGESMTGGRVFKPPGILITRAQRFWKNQLPAMGSADRLANVSSAQVALEDEALLAESSHGLPIGRKVFGLPGGRSVPFDAQPVKRGFDSSASVFAGPPGVEVFVAKDDSPAETASRRPVQEEGAGITEMEVASRTGRQASGRSRLDSGSPVVFRRAFMFSIGRDHHSGSSIFDSATPLRAGDPLLSV